MWIKLGKNQHRIMLNRSEISALAAARDILERGYKMERVIEPTLSDDPAGSVFAYAEMEMTACLENLKANRPKLYRYR